MVVALFAINSLHKNCLRIALWRSTSMDAETTAHNTSESALIESQYSARRLSVMNTHLALFAMYGPRCRDIGTTTRHITHMKAHWLHKMEIRWKATEDVMVSLFVPYCTTAGIKRVNGNIIIRIHCTDSDQSTFLMILLSSHCMCLSGALDCEAHVDGGSNKRGIKCVMW
eukprot:324679_1